MAYLRNAEENLEIDYSLDSLWEAIPKIVETLEWTIEENDDLAHTAKIKTKSGSYDQDFFQTIYDCDDRGSSFILCCIFPAG